MGAKVKNKNKEFHYVITLCATKMNDKCRIPQGTYEGIAWGPDRRSIFLDRLETCSKLLGVPVNDCYVLFWYLEENKI